MSENIGRYNVIFEILTKGLNSDEYKHVKEEISELNQEHQKLNKELGKNPPKGSLASLRNEYNVLNNEISTFTKAQRESADGLAKIKLSQNLKQDIRDIEQSLVGVNSKATGLRAVFQSAKTAFAGILAGAAVQQTVGKIFEITKKYQQYNTILKVATGSQQEATKSMTLIEDAAKDTNFQLMNLHLHTSNLQIGASDRPGMK